MRQGTGGKGRHRGGEGLTREIEMLADAEVTVLSERRTRGPWGLDGGQNGAPGLNELLRVESVERLPGKFSRRLKAGERIRVSTPGGGGHGRL